MNVMPCRKNFGAAVCILFALVGIVRPSTAAASDHGHHGRHHHHHPRQFAAKHWRHTHRHIRLGAFIEALGHAPITMEPEVFGHRVPFDLFASIFAAPRAAAGAVDDLTRIPRNRVMAMVADAARQLNVPVRLAFAVAIQEGASCTRIGGAGERGPMQVRPQTAHAMGLWPRTCADWAYAGVRYLRQALDIQQPRYGLLAAVSAYNHGWGRVYGSRYGVNVLRIAARLGAPA